MKGEIIDTLFNNFHDNPSGSGTTVHTYQFQIPIIIPYKVETRKNKNQTRKTRN